MRGTSESTRRDGPSSLGCGRRQAACGDFRLSTGSSHEGQETGHDAVQGNHPERKVFEADRNLNEYKFYDRMSLEVTSLPVRWRHVNCCERLYSAVFSWKCCLDPAIFPFVVMWQWLVDLCLFYFTRAVSEPPKKPEFYP